MYLCFSRSNDVSINRLLESDISFIFFFQAEDGIRDYKVTGVQTCALPICAHAEETPLPRLECSDEQRAGGDGLRPQVRGDLPAPRPHLVRGVVDGSTQGAGAAWVLDRGDHPDEIDLFPGPLRPEVAGRRSLELGGQRSGICAEVEDLRPRPLLC